MLFELPLNVISNTLADDQEFCGRWKPYLIAAGSQHAGVIDAPDTAQCWVYSDNEQATLLNGLSVFRSVNLNIVFRIQ